MARVSARVLSRDLRRALKFYPNVAERRIRLAMKQHGLVFEREMNKRFGAQLVGPWKRNPTNRLATRTGALRRSIKVSVIGTGAGLVMRARAGGAHIPYARIHETGGTIQGKPWLKIPAPANLTAAGVVRFRRRLPDSFIIKNKKGTLMVARPAKGGRKNKGKIEVLWILVREVRIRPRLKFAATFERLLPQFLTRLDTQLRLAKKEALGASA